MRLSFRWRLTLWITAALAIVLTCFAILVYGMLRKALLEQADRPLVNGMEQLQSDRLMRSNLDAQLHFRIKDFKEDQHLTCIVYRQDGTVLAQTDGVSKVATPPMPPRSRLGSPSSESMRGLGRQRTLTEQMRLGSEDYIVMLLTPLDALDRELNQVAGVMLVSALATLLLAAGLAYGLARKALSPVGRIRRATEAITADHLDERLPVVDPHDELGMLAQTINAMIARLERSFDEIRRFSADASHELRTPLTALRTAVEVALSKPLSEPECRHLLSGILEELVWLSRLTDQLLGLSRQDAGVEPLAFAKVDLPLLVAGVVDVLRPLAESKGVLLNLAAFDPVEIEGSEEALRRMLINLLHNAIKYTPQQGTVSVYVDQRGATGVISIEDTGVGIPAEHLPHVFDRFYRVDKTRSRTEGGTGLGLSIARSIVDAHDGKIDIRSSPGHGTTCTVALLLRHDRQFVNGS